MRERRALTQAGGLSYIPGASKDARTPEQAGMPLLAVPYAPSHAEALIMANRRILADQMAFLETRVPRRRREHGVASAGNLA